MLVAREPPPGTMIGEAELMERLECDGHPLATLFDEGREGWTCEPTGPGAMMGAPAVDRLSK
jgi:hypothetical protein